MIKLYDKVKEYAKNGNNLLDLYCGTGTIGMYLKDSYKYILGLAQKVEENGGEIYEDSEVIEVKKCDDEYLVKTNTQH